MTTAYLGRDLEVGAVIPNYNLWSVSAFLPFLKGRVLEVGAGIGNVAECYVNQADEAVLLEPAKNLFPQLQERFAGSKNVRCVSAMLEDVAGKAGPDADFSAGSFDAAIMVNVLEHIPDDVATLKVLRASLKPGGMLGIFVPALPVLYGTIDEHVGHQRRYTTRSLSKAVESAGFRIEKLHYFDALGALPWFVFGRVFKVKVMNASGARTWDDVVVPIASRVEKVFPPLLGKNAVCIARAA